MTEEEQEEKQTEVPLYTLQWWRQSNSRNGAICGRVFNHIDQECEHGSFFWVHLDRTLNLNNLQEGRCVVSTIATKEGSSLVRLGARQRTEEEEQQHKSKSSVGTGRKGGMRPAPLTQLRGQQTK